MERDNSMGLGDWFQQSSFSCKHFYQDKDGNVWLISANEDFKDTNVIIPCDSDIRFNCRGKVLGHSCKLPDYFKAE